MTSRVVKIAAAAAFLACILLANYVTTEYGLVTVWPADLPGPLLLATAGTYFAGLTFVLRDLVQDTSGKRVVLALIVLGAALSYLVADPFIATASAAAFLVSELVDFSIYTPLRSRGYMRAAAASNIAGAFADTFLFLWIAGFPIAGMWQGQIVGKLTVTGIALGLVWLNRRRRSLVTR